MTNERIDLNRADVSTLATLPGIGEVLAQRIIEYREMVHPFEEVIELAAVPGISEGMVRDFEERVTVAADETSTVEPEPELELDREEIEVPAVQPMAALPSTRATADSIAAEAEVEAEGREPMIPDEQPETEPEPVPTLPTAPAAPGSGRRSCLFLVLGAILGAISGAALTLAILAVLNGGTLFFAQADAQLRRDLNDARQAHTDLSDEINTLTGQLGAVATRAGETALRQAEIDETIDGIERDVAGTQADVDALEQTAGELDERLSNVAEAAETFETFLNGMRNLLVDLQGLPPTATATATPTPLATQTPLGAATDVATATPTPTVTGVPTRTPRPTATPLDLPTAMPAASPTPGQQP